jgi:hypothetical protein
MAIVYICRAIPVEQDSRVLRYISILKRSGHEVRVIQWGKGLGEKVSVISPIPRVRSNPYINFILIPVFNIWLFIYLIYAVNKNNYVLAVDLDTAVSVYLASVFKKNKYIFDIADPFSLSRFNKNIRAVNIIEGIIAKKAFLAIIPELCRCHFYDNKINFLVIGNIPTVSKKCEQQKNNLNYQEIHIGYFGSLEPNYRALELISQIVIDRNDVIFHVGGAGGLSDYFNKIADVYKHKFIYTGSFSPVQLPSLFSKCDIMIAFYSNTKVHHKYVAANKLYEHLYLGIPVLTNKGTNFAEKIFLWKTGWCVNEDKKSIDHILDIIIKNKESIFNKSIIAKEIWSAYYENYWVDSLEVKKFICSII